MATTKKIRTETNTKEWWHVHFASNSASGHDGIYKSSYGEIGIVERRHAVLRILQYYLQPTGKDGAVDVPFIVDAERLRLLRRNVPPPLPSAANFENAHKEIQLTDGYRQTVLHFVPSDEMIVISAASIFSEPTELNRAVELMLQKVDNILKSAVPSLSLPALTLDGFRQGWVNDIGISRKWLYEGLYHAYIFAPDHAQEKDRFATMGTLILFNHTYNHNRAFSWGPKPTLGSTLLSMLRQLGKPQRPCLEKEVVAAICQVGALHAFPPGVIPIVAAYEGRSCPPFEPTCRCGFLGKMDENSLGELFPEVSSVRKAWISAPRDTLESIIKQKIGGGVDDDRRAWTAMSALANQIGISESLVFLLKNVNLTHIRVIQNVVNIAMTAVLYRLGAIRIPPGDKNHFWFHEIYMGGVYLMSDFDPLYFLILSVLKSSIGMC